MKKYVPLFFISIFLSGAYADDASNQQLAMKAQFEQLIQLDEKIENLQKQKLQYKAEIAQHLERGSTGILPGVGRRQARAAEEVMQDVQNINQQIQQLEQQRQAVMMALK